MIALYVVMLQYGEIRLEDVPLPVRKEVEEAYNAEQD